MPAPMMPESLTRPGIFHDMPEVVVTADTLPAAFVAEQCNVPVV